MFIRVLPALEGDEWREMRNRLSPAFTASKLKHMFSHINKCASQFAKFLVTREGARTQPLEFKSAFTRLTNDVIATSAFGLEINTAAQAFIFFFAGYETVATLLAFMAHELAENPEIQARLREEIDNSISEEPLSYESVLGMKYLEMVVSGKINFFNIKIKNSCVFICLLIITSAMHQLRAPHQILQHLSILETLRKYPPAIATDRVCIKNYKVPGTDKVIEAGIALGLPIFGLHRDPEYFPSPDKFDPERFSDENRPKIKPYTYIPFGVGPHNCIGMHFYNYIFTQICSFVF